MNSSTDLVLAASLQGEGEVYWQDLTKCPSGGIGIHGGLKIRALWHAGSTPASGTN